MTWAEDLVRSVGVGNHPLCQLGHEKHRYSLVPIDLSKSNMHIPDIPVVGTLKFQIASFIPDANEDFSVPGYCVARGAVSSSLRHQGVWEGFDTALHLQLLENDDFGIFMDFGSNLGWYTIISRLMGRDVIAFEADGEIMEAMQAGLDGNGIDPHGTLCVHGWIDDNTPVIEAGLTAPHVRLVKSDVEGAEYNVLRILGDLFDAHKIDYMMLELSPMFGGYDRTLAELKRLETDYELFIVPDKGYHPGRFAVNPLECTINHHAPKASELTTQETGLLVRRDLL